MLKRFRRRTALAVGVLALGTAGALAAAALGGALTGQTSTVVQVTDPAITIPGQVHDVTVPISTVTDTVTNTVTDTVTVTDTGTGTTPPPPPPPSGSKLGVYRGSMNPSGVATFASWLGKPVPIAEEWTDGSSWTGIEGAGILAAWKGKGYQLVLGLPLFTSGGSLSACASGSYDSHYTALAQNLKADGLNNTIVRPGWEFNGNWYAWFVNSAQKAADFASCFRHVVSSMRAVDSSLLFDWNPANGAGSYGAYDFTAAYPGDAYVDYVGPDVYDQTWVTPQTPQNCWNNLLTDGGRGLNWWPTFAAAHNKPLAIPEWGLTIRSDGHGLGDDPYYVDQMASYISGHNFGFTVYFDYQASDGKHKVSPPEGTSQFPNAQKEFLVKFG